MTVASLTYSQLLSLYSIGKAFASNDKFTPVLANVHITVDGDALTAAVTDRYRAAVLEFKLDGTDSADGELLLPMSLLTRVVSGNKGDKVQIAHYNVDDDNEQIRVTDTLSNSVLVETRVVGNFPPIMRLFADVKECDIPAGTMLKPASYGDLASVLLPGERPVYAKDQAYAFTSTSDSGRAPVLATRSTSKHEGADRIRVLIQPNLILR